MGKQFACLQFLRVSFFVFLLIVASLTSTFAGTVNAPGSGVPVPLGTWVKVLTRDLPVQTNDWEQLVYISPIQRSMMLSQYHQNNSEPNESLIGYNFDTNTWDVMDMGGLFHTENMPEGGESQGYFDFDPLTNTIDYHCCTSGSNQSENVNHTWWFDVLGQSGRDEQTPLEPLSLQGGGAFDVAHNVAVLYGGASYVGTWLYDPTTNVWQPILALGTLPDPSVILPGMAYSTVAQQVFLYGGKSSSGTIFYPDLYYYDVPSNTWSIVSPANGVKPPARCCMNFAYDSTNNIFLLYGGKNASGVLNDTWVYDPVANLWTEINPPQSPPINSVSDFTRLAYDSDHNAFVLAHLGSGGYFGGDWTSLAMQTWLFRYAGTGPNAATLLSTTQPSPGALNRNLQSWGKDPTLATSGSSLYVAWSETGSPFDTSQAAWPHIYADQYSGSGWSTMGNYSAISGSTVEAHAPSLAVIGGTPWISWYQNVNRQPQVNAASWNGSVWQGGTVGLVDSSGVQGRSTLGQVAGTPYIGVIEVNKSLSPQSAYAYVRSWNGSSWSLVGSGALNLNEVAGTTATSISLSTDGTYPYAAWTEYVRSDNVPNGQTTTNPQLYVSRWNGSLWVPVGASVNVSASSGWANDASLAYFNGQPYVAWTERTQTGNAQLYVATWNGSSWALTGSGSLNQGGANGWAYRPSLITDPTGSNLYVAWVEQTALGQKAQVFVSQYNGGSWSLLGGPLNMDPVNGSAQRVSLGVLNGQPVAAWSEVIFGTVRQVYVAQWNGSTWTQIPGNVVTDTTPPTKPPSLVTLAVSSTQINLAWAGSTDNVGVYGYYVYRNGTQVATVTSSDTYQDTGLTPSTTYTYTVAAYDTVGNISAQSSKSSATTFANSNGPTVSITAPTNGATLSGTVTLSANATDGVGIAYVQFQLNGTNLGSPITGPGPVYSMNWNTTTTNNGSYQLTAVATDNSGNTANTSISITVNNSQVIEPVISQVEATNVTSSGATITWTTDEPSTSQVQYGTTPSYGSSTPLNPALVTSHSVPLSGLQASTTYNYAVFSQNAQGNQNNSGNMVFTTSAPGLQTILQIQGNPSEVSGTSNGSTVTPSVAPSGFTGSVLVNGTGSVNFTPAQSGNGVYFLNCCGDTNNAFFEFGGALIGNIFNANQGQISFSLQSQYSFAQRESSAAAPRYSFDVRDGSGKHQFSFLTEVASSQLEYNYMVGGVSHVYYVPVGTENTLFGDGVILQVTISWDAGGANLYFNGGLVQSVPYTPSTPNWNSGSNFDLGAYQYSSYGGYNVSDDMIFGFSVAGPSQ
jgi:chitodextrinase